MFELVHENIDAATGARAGQLKTVHCIIDTPCFMPVATKATVKTLTPQELDAMGTQAIISNAFHLYLRPGAGIIEKAGGLHRFMNWYGSIFTDSGGFQIIRKDFPFKITDSGLIYKNPRDGKKYTYSPEECIHFQNLLDSDVAMVLDDCPPVDKDREYVCSSVKRTIEWAKRAKMAHGNEKQMIFAIVQGGLYKDIRERCVRALTDIGFDGYGIGGLSIGESKEDMNAVLRFTVPIIPREKPRYLMGVGSPLELLESIDMGIDIFDSAFPTRNARHETLMTKNGNIDIGRSIYSDDFNPIEYKCQCFTCRNHTKAYIHHLFRESELLALRLASIHNLHFMQSLVKDARLAILEDRFAGFKAEFIESYSGGL